MAEIAPPMPTNEATKDVWAIIPAGGRGQRFSAESGQNKLLAMMAGQPVLTRTFTQVLRIPGLAGLVIAAPPEYQVAYRACLQGAEQLANTQVPTVWVAGGPTRQVSVRQALEHVPKTAPIVLIHDAARPLLDPDIVLQAVSAIRAGSIGAVVGYPARDTLKQVDPDTLAIQGTPDRETCWQVQTPQVFLADVLRRAHVAAAEEEEEADTATDDSQLVEALGCGVVRVIAGSPLNLKITHADDIRIAHALLSADLVGSNGSR